MELLLRMDTMTNREKWRKYLAGEDVGPMVCPLCDKWGAGDIAYKWDGPEPEPFAGDEGRQAFRGQLMMARTFGWDPLFYASIKFKPRDASLEPAVTVSCKNGRRQAVSVIKTPPGDLTRVDEYSDVTHRCVKDYLETESDYEKMTWYTEQICDFDAEAALEDGRRLRAAASDHGMIGTWVSPSVSLADIQVLFYHIMDYPEAFERLRLARKKLMRRHLEVYRAAGFDFMFYCVPGTDTGSPCFYRNNMQEEIRETMAWWKSNGGFTLWHSCGHVRAFIEEGIYNETPPEMLETLSEPPVGNIPSLSWALERLDPKIITKGNIPLDILLNGAPEDVREAVRRVKSQARGRRHVIALSDNILNGTPAANLRAYVDEGYRY